MKKGYEKFIKINGLSNATHSYVEAMIILEQMQEIFKITAKDGYYHIRESEVLCICTKGKDFYLTVINGGSITFMKNEKDYGGRPLIIKGNTIEEVVTKFTTMLSNSYCCRVYVTEQRSEGGHGDFEAMYDYKIKEVDGTVLLLDYHYSSRSTSLGSTDKTYA